MLFDQLADPRAPTSYAACALAARRGLRLQDPIPLALFGATWINTDHHEGGAASPPKCG
jgi:hypothetical protein